jgi:hypothetical protein
VTSKWVFTGAALSDETYDFLTILKDGACGANATTADALTNTGSCASSGVTGGISEKVCEYGFDKTTISGMDGYTAGGVDTQPTLELCEIASTVYNSMTITEEYLAITISFENSASFNVTDISMEKATILENTETTSLANYITAANCGTSTLPPNTPLCIQISSSSSDVLIESLDTMSITGNTAAGGSLAVVSSSNTASYPAITSIEGVDTTDVTVTTRVPTNTFDFEATGAAITVTGSVTVKFAGRRLTVDVDRLLQAANNEETASFDVNVQLASEPELALEGGEEVMMNSANAAAGKAFAILGMVFASAFALF